MELKYKILIGFFTVFAVSVFGISQLSAHASSVDRTRDCDKYSIVYCGTMSTSEIRDTYNEKDHAAVYAAFGISKSDISGDIRKGVVYQDGRVVVGGKTVATNAVMSARYLGGSSISGSSTAKKLSVSHMGSAQEALVKFNSDGEFEWAIMTPCGNPVIGKPVVVKKPVYVCNGLDSVSLSRNEYEFTTDASTKNGASIVGYTYTFGDGTTTKAGATTTHTYKNPGTYDVSVKVSVSVHGKTITAPGTCVTTVTITPENCPIPGKEQYPNDSDKCAEDVPSIDITKTVNNVEHAVVDVNEAFTYEIVVTNTGEVTIENAIVTDKIPSAVTAVSASLGDIDGHTWKYTIPSLGVGESKSITITAKYSKYSSGTDTNKVCVDTPTIPSGPDACDEASTETREEPVPPAPTPPPATPDTPEAPAELPHTGIADGIGAVLGLGSLVGASAAYIASRRSM